MAVQLDSGSRPGKVANGNTAKGKCIDVLFHQQRGPILSGPGKRNCKSYTTGAVIFDVGGLYFKKGRQES